MIDYQAVLHLLQTRGFKTLNVFHHGVSSPSTYRVKGVSCQPGKDPQVVAINVHGWDVYSRDGDNAGKVFAFNLRGICDSVMQADGSLVLMPFPTLDVPQQGPMRLVFSK